jgi:hypothetical protein
MRSHVHADESITDRVLLRSLAAWLSRSLDAMRADLQSPDCGSLDILLYCPDDVAGDIPGNLEANLLR